MDKVLKNKIAEYVESKGVKHTDKIAKFYISNNINSVNDEDPEHSKNVIKRIEFYLNVLKYLYTDC